MNFCKIGIIGLGLIGGSIFKALQERCETIVGEDVLDHLNEINLLILAVPISAILELGKVVANKEGLQRLVVLDVGSVKEEIARCFESWSSDKIEFVASHPMAGKEQSGFEASDPMLFQEAPWVVTPHKKNSEEGLFLVKQLIELLGAKPLWMTASAHDHRAALVSHMPYLVSKALLELAKEDDEMSLEMEGPGFRSMTRLAHDNPILRSEIYQHNRQNIQNALKKLIQRLERME